VVLYAANPPSRPRCTTANSSPAQFSIALFILIDAASYSKSSLNGSSFHITFVDWIPGIFSALGMLVINSIDKTRLSGDGFSYSGDGVAWKARVVLFMGFAAMAGGLAGGVCVMVLKYVVNESVWPSLWMGVANIIANALVMLRYVIVESIRVRVRLSSSMLTSFQFRHSVGEPEHGGRLHVQPCLVRVWRAYLCSVPFPRVFNVDWHISIHYNSGAFTCLCLQSLVTPQLLPFTCKTDHNSLARQLLPFS